MQSLPGLWRGRAFVYTVYGRKHDQLQNRDRPDDSVCHHGYVFDQKFDYGELAGVSGGFRTDYSSAFGRGSKPFTFPHFNGYFRLFHWASGMAAKSAMC